MRRLMETLSADSSRPGRFRVVRILSTMGTTCTRPAALGIAEARALLA